MNHDTIDPQFPIWTSITQVGFTVVVVVTLVVALALVWRRRDLPVLERFGWSVLSLAVPVIGPAIAILVVARSRRTQQAP